MKSVEHPPRAIDGYTYNDIRDKGGRKSSSEERPGGACMAADVLIGLSTAIFALALLEIFLSEEQKRSLANGVLQIWNVLDEIKRRSYLEWFRRGKSIPKVLFVLAICLVSLLLLFVASGRSTEAEYLFFVAAICIAIPFILLTAWFVISRLLEPLGAFETLVRIVLLALILYLPAWIGKGIEVVTDSYFLNVVATALAIYAYAMLLIWFVATAPLVFAYALTAVLWTCEFVVRRIAEYPKGPLLAVSGLIAALAAFTKAMI
jgi:hypothetical protein